MWPILNTMKFTGRIRLMKNTRPKKKNIPIIKLIMSFERFWIGGFLWIFDYLATWKKWFYDWTSLQVVMMSLFVANCCILADFTCNKMVGKAKWRRKWKAASNKKSCKRSPCKRKLLFRPIQNGAKKKVLFVNANEHISKNSSFSRHTAEKKTTTHKHTHTQGQTKLFCWIFGCL